MPRIRTIKPEFWDSPDTARADLRTRLLYIAMWNWADDYGKGTANPKQLVGFAFPNDDDVTVSDWPTLAKAVSDAYGVVFYEADRRPYFAIPSFGDHQRTEKRAASRIPDPPEGASALEPEAEKPWYTGARQASVGASAPSVGASVPVTGEQGNRGTGEQPPSPTRSAVSVDDVVFDRFWDAYGKKVGRRAAVKAFQLAVKRGADPERIIAAAQEHQDWHKRASTEWSKVPHPTTWLNRDGWEDERPSPAQAAGTSEGSAWWLK